MILIDTSIWADHLGRANPHHIGLLERNVVFVHPFIEGELALGNLKNRVGVLGVFALLPRIGVVSHLEVLAFIDRQRLAGHAVGYVDAHILASAYAAGDVSVWSRDKRMNAAAAILGIQAEPPFAE